MKDKLKRIISDRKVLIIVYIILVLIASIQSLLLGSKPFTEAGVEYKFNDYNNYVIFEKSFEHLKNNQDLYITYPEEHWDLYKYTPSFSVFFGFFNMFPDWIGLHLWNLLNVMVLLLAIYYLPNLSNYQKGLALVIVLIELMTATQNEQSNTLIAGLTIFSFGLFEKKKSFLATLCLALSAFIKLFGIVGFVLVLFYPKKLKSIMYALCWIVILLAIPLVFVDYESLIKLYGSYLKLLTDDHIAYGCSVMGCIHTWFSVDFDKNLIVALGVIIFLLPFYRIKMYKEFMFKYLLLCSVLIWVVIFNHKAESPTFIIAMAGVALWFVKSEKSTLNITLLVIAFLITSLSPTDIFPRYLRVEFVKPYELKALPCILIWIKIIYDMMTLKKENSAIPQAVNNSAG